ncbi:MAG: hypothetical protein N2246_03570 [Candidatus Sumerlaeia bacterium]|nr:hypothetical protein [Candidatus Sumerlaeia bacterium]
MSRDCRKIIILLVNMGLLSVILSCKYLSYSYKPEREYNSILHPITIPNKTAEQRKRFNRYAVGEKVTLQKENGKVVSGYVTSNKEFLEKIMKPLIEPHLEELASRHPVEMINTLTIFAHTMYQIYFGRDSFRWGGDILDLDDPQERGIRYKYRYGLDCSGFASMPYELAVYFGLMKAEDEGAIFSSAGFRIYCEKHQIKDTGGRDGTSNRYRVDTVEMAKLGRLVFELKQGETATVEQLQQLQAGDLVGREGHFGIIVELEGKPYYLESGGWVVPPRGGRPYPADKSLKILTQRGPIMVRRSLPDYRK